ncbi:hypothetical protein [Oryzibacter oryziterrae]|uniref:hypothetical protein n=1 Tax=Oryzibacter oryziterrae TaxID=2766474 RepID=UPI001F323ABE|nr:hypothetical protein [Oryzibacter oryziterrae]
MKLFAMTAAAALVALALPAEAKPPVKIERLNAYQIWEDSGELSEKVPKESEQITANGDKGSSTQMIVDTVVSGPKGELVEPTAELHVWAAAVFPPEGQPANLVDQTWPLNFVGMSGLVYRSVVVSHECQPFDFSAQLIQGNKKGPVVTRRLNIFCGD